MEVLTKAIEATGTIDDRQRVLLDDPLPLGHEGRVRLLILFPDDEARDEREWLATAAQNPAFNFLNDPAEDVYTLADGKPFDDQG